MPIGRAFAEGNRTAWTGMAHKANKPPQVGMIIRILWPPVLGLLIAQGWPNMHTFSQWHWSGREGHWRGIGDLASPFGIFPCFQAIPVGFNFASVSTALRAAVPTIALKVIIRARYVDPYDSISRAMSLRCLLGFKGLHPLIERCATSQQNH